MAAKKGTGLLMVWADVPADKEDDFNRWYNEEHLAERLSVPGFLDAARYEAVKNGPKHLACYELESPAVLESPAYKRVQANPTPWTRRCSPDVIGTTFIRNVYAMIHPEALAPDAAQSGMAPALQIGRMDVPPEIDADFNAWYNTIYVPNYETVPGVIRGRRYRAVVGVADLPHALRVRAPGRVRERGVARPARRRAGDAPDTAAHAPCSGFAGHLRQDVSALVVTPAGGDLVLTVETSPDARDVEALGQGLTDHALPFTHRPGFQPLAVFARDRNGALVGGVHGQVNWTWLHVALFWIAAGERRRGLGSSLLRAIEAAAVEWGCTQAHLDTFSYQARPFYERHGYALFATLDDYPPGHQRFFLRKVLGAIRAG